MSAVSNIIMALAPIVDARAKEQKRTILAIAGTPASGKSTLAEQLAQHYGEHSIVVPMDGFHLDNAILQRHGMLERKGSEATFDALGCCNLVERIAANQRVYAPRFDRDCEQSIAAAIEIDRQRLIIVEGNYLLLNRYPWDTLHSLYHYTVYVDYDDEVLVKRLEQRWREHGVDAEMTRHKIVNNDLRNATYVREHSVQADYNAVVSLAS